MNGDIPHGYIHRERSDACASARAKLAPPTPRARVTMYDDADPVTPDAAEVVSVRQLKIGGLT